MALEYQVNPNEDLFIRLQLSSNDTGLYPQTKIYAIDAPTTVVDTINLDELSNGLYGKKWTNNGIKTKYFTQTRVFTDAGYTTVHPIIRPDSDSINVGFNSSGGVFGGKSKGTSIQRLGLTEEEIQKIARAVKELLQPELDKKSEFDASKDKVLMDMQPMEMPPIEFPPIPTVYDIAKAVVNSLDLDNKLGAIKPLPIKFPPVPTTEDIKAIVEEIVGANKFDYSKFDEIKQAIIDNKVVVPNPVDNSEVLEDLKNVMNATLSTMIVKNVIGKITKKQITKKDVFEAIYKNEDTFSIYKLFKKLSVQDRKDVFDSLAEDNIELLKELGRLAEVEGIIKIIDNSEDKESTLKFFFQQGKLNKSMMPLIKLFRQNA